MGNIKIMKKYLNPYKYLHRILPDSVKHMLSDELYLKIEFPAHVGYRLNLENPKTYNEKLNWLKLYDRNNRYASMVDKVLAKEYVASIIGEEYIVPNLGIWDQFDDIDFNCLPNSFVLKTTHDSGGVVICRDKKTFDYKAAKDKITRYLKRDFFYICREWPYKDLKHRVLAEEYLENDCTTLRNMPLMDYKVYTFNGVAKLAMINTGRGVDTRADYFDKEYNWLDFKWGYEHAENIPPKPTHYEEMFNLAEKLAEGTSELRVDFYESNGRVYFGEMTFFDGGGFDPIEPFDWDIKMGSWIVLPHQINGQ